MLKKKAVKESDKALLANVNREMAQPRVAGSAQTEARKQGTQDPKGSPSANSKTGQQGGPGPHGSSDPETAERNKNKPLMDDWGKGDKH
jgi:hypothetical protein